MGKEKRDYLILNGLSHLPVQRVKDYECLQQIELNSLPIILLTVDYWMPGNILNVQDLYSKYRISFL